MLPKCLPTLCFPSRHLTHPSEQGQICPSLRDCFTLTALPVPVHAFNHLPYSFVVTPDKYRTLIRLLTLSGASPIGPGPLLSLPSHNPLRDGFCPPLRRTDSAPMTSPHTHMCLQTPFKSFLLSLDAYWILSGPLPPSDTFMVGPAPQFSAFLPPKTL